MKVAKIKNVKQNTKNSKVNRDDYSLKSIIIIILILTAIFFAFYLVTSIVIKGNSTVSNSTSVVEENKITISKLFSEKESEYFVLVLKDSNSQSNNYSDINYNSLYNKYISDYNKKDNSLKFYKAYLSDALNSNYLGSETTITNDLSNIKFNDDTLLKVKDGNIEEYFVGNKEIINKLSNL